MSSYLSEYSLSNLDEINASKSLPFATDLETGNVVFLPNYSFLINNPLLFDQSILGKKSKNISFNSSTVELNGYNLAHVDPQLKTTLVEFMSHYAEFAKQLVHTLCPNYIPHLQWGRTSYRPAEIKNRPTSKRKDDTRLHVDSFAATPVHGLRILRVFSNVNPHQQPRCWHLGESFAKVAAKFSPNLPAYQPLIASLIHALKLTKTKRSAYDHYQLKLHDQMKLSDDYQQSVKKTTVNFPASSTWLVYSDSVSHAALSGQYLLEQTFYLPVEAMENPDHSPLKHWQRLKSF